ncbi:hypothetical protein Tco_1385160 [Tanacetum coccineum]
MVINSPCLTDKKYLAIPGQTATGKEFSNPLMAGSFPKTISAKFWNTATSKTVNSVKQIHAIVDGKAVVITESSLRNDLLLDDDDDITCLTNDEIFENLTLMGSISTCWNEFSTNLASAVICLAKGQKFNFSKLIFDGNGYMWQSQAPRNHGGAPAQIRIEHTFELMDIVPPTPHDSPLPGGYTPGSDEGRLKLEELMAMWTKLSKQTKPIFKDSDFDDLDDLVDEGIENHGKIGADHTEAVNTTGEGVNTVAPRTPPTTTTIFDDEDVTMAMAQTLIKIKEEKAKEKGVAIKDVEDSSRPIRSITSLQPLLTIDPKDKGKGILQETEPMEKTKKKVQGDAQIERDAKIAFKTSSRIV